MGNRYKALFVEVYKEIKVGTLDWMLVGRELYLGTKTNAGVIRIIYK